ncbi:hypothetical protein MRX96_029930 [Rhipicephalus microplus]
MPLYAKHGIDVKLGRSEDVQYWVVLVATPIMRRAQLLNAAKEQKKLFLLIRHHRVIHHEAPWLFFWQPRMRVPYPSWDTINAQGEQHNPVPQDEMAATTPPQDEEMPDSEAVLDTESCASISHLEQQESEDADNSLEALIEQLRQVHAEEKSNAAYRRHLLSGTKRLRRLQEQKRGVGAMMAMDAALEVLGEEAGVVCDHDEEEVMYEVAVMREEPLLAASLF